MIIDYCTQNDGDCLSCSLSSYGRDCMNNPITYKVGDLSLTLGLHVRQCAKMLNDAGVTPRLDEIEGDPEQRVTREDIINLIVDHAGDRIGRKLAELIG